MYCLKCGKSTEESQVFCPECLEIMHKYPVKPETHIHLPKRAASPQTKKAARRKKGPSPEEQISRLRRTVRGLGLLVVLLSLCVALLSWLHFGPEGKEDLDGSQPGSTVGQNYSVGETTRRVSRETTR